MSWATSACNLQEAIRNAGKRPLDRFPKVTQQSRQDGHAMHSILT